MSNLKRELRVNKNGVAVTKIVRADDNPSKPGRGIPSPKAKRPTTKAEYADAIVSFLLVSDLDTEDSRDFAKSFYRDTLGGKSLKMVHDRMKELDTRNDRAFFEMVLMQTVRNSIANLDSQLTRDKIVACLVEAMPIITKFAGPDAHIVVTSSAVIEVSRKTRHYGVNLRSDENIADDRTLFRYLMFETLFVSESGWRDRETALDDARWFEDNMDRLEPHVKTLRERKTVDRGFLSDLIDERSAAPLQDGVL